MSRCQKASALRALVRSRLRRLVRRGGSRGLVRAAAVRPRLPCPPASIVGARRSRATPTSAEGTSPRSEPQASDSYGGRVSGRRFLLGSVVPDGASRGCRLNRESLLGSVGPGCRQRRTTMKLLDKLRPQPKIKHADPAVRLEGVQELDDTDQAALIELATDDGDARVRRAASARVTDAAALAAIVRNESDT